MSSSSSAAAARPLPFVAPITDALSPFVLPALRVTAGVLMMPHGAQKLFGWFGGYGLEATGQFFQTKLGMPAGMALLAGLIEFFGGLALAVGFLTRPAAALATGLMVVALVSVHLNLGFFWTSGGFEYPLMWAILTLAFVIRGGGRYSVDSALGWEI